MATATDPQLKQSGRSEAAHRDQRREHASSGLVQSHGRLDVLQRTGNPLDAIWQLSREIDRLMGSAFGPFGHAQGMWSPQFDVEHHQDSIIVKADLPGINKEELFIEAGDETLTVRGERRQEGDISNEALGYRAYERSQGSFFRSIPLPQHAKVNELKANLRNGVLTVTVPLDEKSRPHRITIET
jgi:HSP20 family protein